MCAPWLVLSVPVPEGPGTGFGPDHRPIAGGDTAALEPRAAIAPRPDGADPLRGTPRSGSRTGPQSGVSGGVHGRFGKPLRPGFLVFSSADVGAFRSSSKRAKAASNAS